MIFNFNSLREYIKAVIEEKKAKNPLYSANAFAKRIGISGAMLTEVLKGRKFLSKERCYQAANELELTENEKSYFILLSEYDAAKDPDHKATLEQRIRISNPKYSYQTLDRSKFFLLDKWYYASILELTYIEGVLFKPEVISHTLGIELTETTEALKKLVEEGFLTIDEQYKGTKIHSRIVAESQNTNVNLKQFYRQTLELAALALDTQESGDRYFASETFPLSYEGLESVKSLSDRFLNEVIEISKNSKHRDRVYHVGLQFVRLADLSQNSVKKKLAL